MYISNLNLSSEDFKCLDEIIAVLEASQKRETTIERVRAIVEKYHRTPLNGIVRGEIVDLECMLGIFEGETLDYVPSDEKITDAERATLFLKTLKIIRTQKDFELPENQYKIYQRWVVFDNSRIEVEILAQEWWDHQFFKSKHSDEYFLSIIMEVAGGVWDKVFKLDGERLAKITKGVDTNNRQLVKEVVREIKDEYFTELHNRRR